MYYVYVDVTNDNIPYYVGQGIQRRVDLLHGRNKKHTNVSNKHGQNRIVVHETPDYEEVKSMEMWWIEQCATFVGHPLADKFACNYTLGGDGSKGCKQSEETRAKRGKALKGRKRSPEAIAKTAAKNTGKKRTPEQCLNIGKAAKGLEPWNKGKKNPYTDEWIENQRKLQTGNKNAKGSVRTEEQKKALSDRQKGKTWGNNKGRKQRPEVIAKRVETIKRNREEKLKKLLEETIQKKNI